MPDGTSGTVTAVPLQLDAGAQSSATAAYSISDATRRLIDDEQQHITDHAVRRAYALLEANRPVLDELAGTLLEQESLERQDIERIVARSEDFRPRVAASKPPEPGEPAG